MQIFWTLNLPRSFEVKGISRLRIERKHSEPLKASPSLSFPSLHQYLPPLFYPFCTLLKVSPRPGRCVKGDLAWKMENCVQQTFIYVSGAPFSPYSALSITKCDNIASHRGSLLTIIHPNVLGNILGSDTD